LKESKYALKYALIYSGLIAAILLAPLFFYTIYMKNIHAIQNELLLKEKSLLIVKSMEEFNQNENYYEYPRFRSFQSGLYDRNFNPLFTLIDSKIKYFKEGYYLDEGDAYLVVALPHKRYFGASYLILKNKLSFAVVYEKVMVILFSIVILVFVLSLFFLDRFAKPFKQVNRRLDTFIKDSMHEINTPLSIINVNIDLYNRKNPTNKYLQRIKAASKVLSNIYNDMDYLIKNERLNFEKEWIDLSAYLLERIEYFTEVAHMKNIEIYHEIEEGIKIYANQKQLQRVIDNNISNAIKYSYDNNKIEIFLALQEDGCHLRFKDYGVGIEDVAKIFDRYYREDTQKGGFGIGLNIVATIIKKAGIKLEIDSELKKGTSFIYIIPLEIIKHS
jgi:two-component system, OmpR family, sensor kinase